MPSKTCRNNRAQHSRNQLPFRKWGKGDYKNLQKRTILQDDKGEQTPKKRFYAAMLLPAQAHFLFIGRNLFQRQFVFRVVSEGILEKWP
ncbi:MAG: hypothetical protein BROFUL_00760 [Candidatus Brocadia fulgida]|uniref:Uncharacterized protein n=1 Tax=Candidatus Brocadia fulgida TaxID=380242 RepID=A0A0M2UZY0_9BACT|nr:MAG: hypothetical protein BROFUL_00760 [Candidatus Brocadia fulgida]